MREPSKSNTWMTRVMRYLRDWPARHGRTVHDQMIRGVSYGVGSGAVSLLIVWYQSRR